MSLVESWRHRHRPLWERAVGHPFVRELADGSLPPDRFRRYFEQDYLFVRDLWRLTALGVAGAPDPALARPLADFLSVLLGAEEELFRRAFDWLGVSAEELAQVRPLPTCRAFCDFMLRTAHEDGFFGVLAVLACTEGVYHDWATRLREAGASPPVPAYREWIDIHADPTLGRFVSWVASALESAPIRLRPHLGEVFHTALRYEVAFWDMAYHGQNWPDEEA